MVPDVSLIRAAVARAHRVVFFTGAGVSAESGVATFRGAGGLWEAYRPEELASPSAFRADPLLVWRFYDHRRQKALQAHPNPGHHAIAAFVARWRAAGRSAAIVTQNVDDLHEQAGADAVHLHGRLFEVRCTGCGRVTADRRAPMPGLDGGSLPECVCGGVLRPNIVWFGENLDPRDLEAAYGLVSKADVLFVVGTSAVVWPAAGLVPHARRAGATIIEVNPEDTDASDQCAFTVRAPSGQALPVLLDVEPA
jgi:NAD-dependent deacetylase sirtuin 5